MDWHVNVKKRTRWLDDFPFILEYDGKTKKIKIYKFIAIYN